ncbi:MAG TPA: terminase TerL endonuclease subunit [Nitrospiraceae bacterium]|nr:terminase TerL endonuclease subunit [Nitrospiraceae bacterium]
MNADLRSVPAFGGLDLAAKLDLTAFALAWPVEDLIYVHAWFWLPEEGLAERCRRDNVRYDVWAKEGHLELTPGNVTDWRFVTERIRRIRDVYPIAEIGFDRWGARDITADLEADGFTCFEVGQGYGSMNAPARRLEELVLSGKLRHNGHPLLRWCLDCTTVRQDEAGNIKPVKPDRLKSSKRIDGIVALLMALSRAMQADTSVPAVWSLEAA